MQGVGVHAVVILSAWWCCASVCVNELNILQSRAVGSCCSLRSFLLCGLSKSSSLTSSFTTSQEVQTVCLMSHFHVNPGVFFSLPE